MSEEVKNMNGNVVGKTGRVPRLHPWLFSLNIGFAIMYALFAYEGSSHLADAPKSVRDLLEAFASILARIASLVVSGRTRSEYLRSVLIREAVFVGLVLGVALLLYLLVHFFVRAAARRIVFAAIAGIAALIAVPGCWLYIVHATWSIYDPGTFWGTYGYISVLEIAVAGGVLYLVRGGAVGWGILAFALHYIFWVLVIGERSAAPVLVSIPLSLVFPCSGLAWFFYARQLRGA
jgi:hypothetical protein